MKTLAIYNTQTKEYVNTPYKDLRDGDVVIKLHYGTLLKVKNLSLVKSLNIRNFISKEGVVRAVNHEGEYIDNIVYCTDLGVGT